jgi:hypothetical protein
VTKERQTEACNATIIDKVWVRIPTGANNALLVHEEVNKTSYHFFPKEIRMGLHASHRVSENLMKYQV